MFFILLRRKRRGFSLTRAHDQCWYVNDNEKECENNSTSPLTHSFNALTTTQPQNYHSKCGARPPFDLLKLYTRNERNPKDTNRPTQTQKEVQRALEQLSLGSSFETSACRSRSFFLHFLSPHPCPLKKSHSPSMPWLDQLSFSFSFTPNGSSFDMASFSFAVCCAVMCFTFRSQSFA